MLTDVCWISPRVSCGFSKPLMGALLLIYNECSSLLDVYDANGIGIGKLLSTACINSEFIIPCSVEKWCVSPSVALVCYFVMITSLI